MKSNVFRDFSIRGIADKELSDPIVTDIGCAIGTFLRKRGGSSLTAGRDARVSSERINRAVIKGILQSGISVTEIGVVPTPVLNFATDYYGSDGGVMITASHNPPEYNGLKIRTDITLGRDELDEIYALTQGGPCQNSGTKQARYQVSNPIPVYLEKVKERADSRMRPLKIVIDGRNGTNGVIVPALLRDLGQEVVEINCVLDGTFPCGSPDPTAPHALDELAEMVKQVKADVGFAYDGDGDRVAVIDQTGRMVTGDQILMLLARDVLLEAGTPVDSVKVVYDVLCSQAVADDIWQHGGTPVVAPSGYFHVHHALQEHGALLGGELSGHFFFNDPDFRFDDSILATVKLLNLLTHTGNTLSQLVDTLPSYYSSDEIRLPCPDTAKVAVVQTVRQQYEREYPIDTVDGVRIHFLNAWALVRQSNTQPVISMRFEAQSAEALEVVQSEVESLVIQTIQEISS